MKEYLRVYSGAVGKFRKSLRNIFTPSCIAFDTDWGELIVIESYPIWSIRFLQRERGAVWTAETSLVAVLSYLCCIANEGREGWVTNPPPIAPRTPSHHPIPSQTQKAFSVRWPSASSPYPPTPSGNSSPPCPPLQIQTVPRKPLFPLKILLFTFLITTLR